MTSRPEKDWSPNSELLAAYFDGEFEGRDDLLDLRRKLEDWLVLHPEARGELAEYKRLRLAWHQTTPREPDAGLWNAMVDRVQSRAAAERSRRKVDTSHRWSRWGRLAVAALAACIVAAAALLISPDRQRSLPPDRTTVLPDHEEPYPVATASEILILRVEGPDASSLVVGALPLEGPIELAGPGDITLTSVQPDARDNMVPDVSVYGPGRPLIWARAETD